MSERTLGIAWVVAGLAFVLLLGFEYSRWSSLRSEAERVGQQRQTLTQAIRTAEEQIVAEMRANTGLLQEMQWTSSGGDPSAFLNRVAELVREKRLRVLAIGNLERQTTPQFNKTWHTIQVVAPYRELRELAGRVEGEKGILEDMRIALPQDQGQPGRGARDEVQAAFKMTALELTADAKRVLDRALAASGGVTPPAAGAPLALPVPTRLTEPVPPGRDPFQFGAAPVVVATGPRGRPAGGPAPGAGPARPAGDDKPEVPLEVSGIVAFPGGFLAIVNNQIVKVGDAVAGHRVERISEAAVVLRAPGARPRTVPLKDLTAAPAPPGARR